MAEGLTVAFNVDPSGAVRGVKVINRSLKGLEQQTGRTERKLDKTNKQLKGLGGAATTLKAALAGLSTGLVLRGAIRELAAFGQAFAEVQALIGKRIQGTGLTFKDLELRAREMAKTMVFSAKEAAEGMKFLVLAGFEAIEVYEALPAALELAQAGALDLGRAADIVSNIMSAFNIEASKTSEVADILAATAAQSNTSILQLGEAFKFAGPIVARVGVSVADASAAIGILGNAGLQASLAGTTLRNIIASLVNPANNAKKAIEQMGLSVTDLIRGLRTQGGFLDMVRQLDEAGLNIQRTFAIFGRRAGPGMQALIVQSRGANSELAKLTERVNDARGAVTEMSRVMGNTLQGDAKTCG